MSGICWAVERRDGGLRFLSWDPLEGGMVWVQGWDRALKLFDRASCEMLCVEMPFDWDVHICDHELVEPLPTEGEAR